MLRTDLPDVPVYPNFDSVFNSYDVSSNEMKGNFNTLETFVVHSLWIKKTSDKQVYAEGEIVNYTITYGNKDPNSPFDNVSIEDDLPDLNYTEYVSASPQPSSINGNVLLWNNIGTLHPGDSGTIQLYLRIKEKCSEMSYKSNGFVSGEGFANIRQNLDTAQKPDHLTNLVTITGYKGPQSTRNKDLVLPPPPYSLPMPSAPRSTSVAKAAEPTRERTKHS